VMRIAFFKSFGIKKLNELVVTNNILTDNFVDLVTSGLGPDVPAGRQLDYPVVYNETSVSVHKHCHSSRPNECAVHRVIASRLPGWHCPGRFVSVLSAEISCSTVFKAQNWHWDHSKGADSDICKL
jgi:hypothetical protein